MRVEATATTTANDKVWIFMVWVSLLGGLIAGKGGRKDIRGTTIPSDRVATSRHTKKRGKLKSDICGQISTSSCMGLSSRWPHVENHLCRGLFDERITRWDVHTFDISIRSQCGLVYSHIFVEKRLGNRPACKSGSTVLNRACLTRTPRQTNALKGTCWCLNPKRRKHLCRHLIVISV